MIFLIYLPLILVDSKLQNITVKGRLTCDGKPLSGYQITLYEYDLGTPNDPLNRTKTNANGEFEIYGEENEVFAINPFIQFEHTCNIEKGCRKEQPIYAGQDFIGGISVINEDLASDGRYGLRFFDICIVDDTKSAEQARNLSVTGFAQCSGQKMGGIDVRLRLRNNTTRNNEIIASSKTDISTGFFKLSVVDETFKYEPFVEFENFCQNQKICARIRVKSEFFGRNYDMSNVDLENYRDQEEFQCDEEDQKI